MIGILWRFLLDPNIGLVNHYLDKIGIHNIPWTTETPWCGRPWSGQRSGGRSASTASSTWPASRTSRVSSTRRPRSTARAWQQFRNVTLPSLRPVLVLITTLTILASANVFGQPYLITQGRPGVETRTAIMYIGQEGLRDFRMGSASAASFLLTVR